VSETALVDLTRSGRVLADGPHPPYSRERNASACVRSARQLRPAPRVVTNEQARGDWAVSPPYRAAPRATPVTTATAMSSREDPRTRQMSASTHAIHRANTINQKNQNTTSAFNNAQGSPPGIASTVTDYGTVGGEFGLAQRRLQEVTNFLDRQVGPHSRHPSPFALNIVICVGKTEVLVGARADVNACCADGFTITPHMLAVQGGLSFHGEYISPCATLADLNEAGPHSPTAPQHNCVGNVARCTSGPKYGKRLLR